MSLYNTPYDKMQVALNEAVRAAALGEVPVGAAVFKDNKLISSACNMKESLKKATSHAEILAIEKACDFAGDWRLCGMELYVTSEPCFMCAGAILQSRIDFVCFGLEEPKFGGVISKGNLFDIPTNHKVVYAYGERKEEIYLLMRDFFHRLRRIGS